MTVIALANRWGRLFSDSALAAVFRDSLLYRLTAKRAEFLTLCLIVLVMPFIPVTASAVLILAAGVLFLARRAAPARAGTRAPGAGWWRGVARLPLLKQMLVFLAVLLLLSFFSVTRRDSLQIALLFGVYIAFYLMCLQELKDDRKIYVLTVVFLVSVSLEACFGLYQNFISRPLVDPSWVDSAAFPEIMVRVFGTLDNPNILAQYLIPGIVMGLALALRPGAPRARWSTRVLFLGGAAIAVASLVYTQSRMGWLALGLAIAVFLLLYDRRLLLLAVAAVILGVTLRPDLLSNRLTSVLNLSQDSSIFYRFQIWQVAVHIIRDFWFSGVGPGSTAFQLIYNKFYAVYGMRVFHTHNLYLELLVEYGVFGTLIFLWLLFSYFSYGLKRVIGQLGAAGRVPHPEGTRYPLGGGAAGFTKMAAMASIAAMVSYLFMGLTENCWYNFKLVFLFWFLISVTVSSARLLSEAPGPTTPAARGAED